MKVLIVMPSAQPHGGAEEALQQLVRHRTEAGIRMGVVFLENGPMVEWVVGFGVEAVVLEAGRLRNLVIGWRTIRELRAMIRVQRPDMVLGWMTKAHVYCGLAVLDTGVPCAYFQMGLPDGGVVDRISRRIPATGVLGCSAFVAREQGEKVKHPVIGVPLGADMKRFETARVAAVGEMKESLGFAPDLPLIGIVGRLQRWKGMHVYLEAMKRVLQEYPDCQGVIVGGRFDAEPDYPEALQKQIQELGLGRQVKMVGTQSNVSEWMQAMDVVVHASDREPFGIVVVEAMSLGKPVIATKPGGPEEIVTDGVDGLLTLFGDADALAKAVKRYLGDKEFARRCGERARLRSHEFSAKRYAGRVGTALRKLVDWSREVDTAL